MKIGEKTLKKGGEILTNALLAYKSKINEAFLNNGEDDLKIGLSLTIKPGDADGNFKLKGDISFVTQKITDSFSDSVDEKQTSLPLDEPTRICPEREDGAEIFESVCAKCKKREGLFISDGLTLPRWWEGDDIAIPDDAIITRMPCRAWADEDYKAWCDEMVRRADVMLEERAARPEAESNKPNLKKVMGGKR